MRPNDIRTGVRRLFTLRRRTRQQSDAEVDAELRSLIDERIDYLVARGMSESDARAHAMARLGQSLADTQRILHTSAARKERHMHLRETLADLAQDLRYTARTLRRDAAFTALAVTIIGLGIGASATVFSVANTLLIRPLPFRDADNLVWIGNKPTSSELDEYATQSGHFLDLREQSRTLAGLAAFNTYYRVGDTRLGGESEAIRVSRVQVTPNFFPLLGVAPALGRNFLPEESGDSARRVVMLSHSLWTQRFHGDASILGSSILMNDNAVTVVGVLPATFDFGSVFAPGSRIDLFTPFPLTARSNGMGNTLALVGRRKPGVSLATAASELNALGAQLTREHPERNPVLPHVMSLREHVSGGAQSALMLLLIAVGAVMLIVCANLSNLLLARATTRQREMAIRAALGAGRRRLLRQMLTESVTLSTCGALLGWLVAVIGTRIISHTNAIALPLLSSVHVDALALAFIAGLAIAAGLLFGAAPAIQLRRFAVQDGLKASGRSLTDSKGGRFVRSSLVVSEIALACVLLVGSGLLFRSFVKMLDVNPGFAPERVLSIRVDPGAEHLKSQEVFNAYLNEVLRLAQEIPGVQSAGVSDVLPLGGARGWGIGASGRVYERGQRPEAFIRVMSDNYLNTMGIARVAGRDFTPLDVTPGAQVIVINESAARRLFPGENAIGRFVKADTDREVVGVVRDVRHLGLDKPSGLEVYLPLRQTGDFAALHLVVRTTLTPSAFATAIRAALQPVVPNLPTNEIQTLTGLVDKSVSPRRFFTSMIGAFALFALVLALLGIYGVIAYTVSHRTQEIGVRIALGASPWQIQGRIIRETLALAGVGIAIGTVGALLLSQTLSSFLFGVSALDPVTFGAMLVVVTAVALMSGYLPARRASRIDPNVAFRAS